MTKQTVNTQKILTYISNSPRGEASLEEILNWWVRSDKGQEAVEEAGNALKLLIEKGEIEEIRSRQDIIIYKIKKKLDG